MPTYHVSRSEYPCVIVEFVFGGKGRLRIGETMHDLYPGVLFSYGMNAPHDLWADDADPMNKFFAIYTCEDSTKLDELGCIHPGQVRCSLDISGIRVLFDHLIDEGKGSGPVQGMLSNQYLQLILLKSAVAASVDPEDSAGNGGLASYEKAVAHIGNHYTEISSLADLAAAVELSPAYLCRLFRRFSKETPHQCLVRHKMNRAAELLMSQAMNVGEVAAAVGYQDTFHFSRLFKKRFGDSPKNFCKNISAGKTKPSMLQTNQK
ncbi:MAG: AraC family transcriptional regulator [Planctomycetota bacterium]